jgi:hypothetical protein
MHSYYYDKKNSYSTENQQLNNTIQASNVQGSGYSRAMHSSSILPPFLTLIYSPCLINRSPGVTIRFRLGHIQEFSSSI